MCLPVVGVNHGCNLAKKLTICKVSQLTKSDISGFRARRSPLSNLDRHVCQKLFGYPIRPFALSKMATRNNSKRAKIFLHTCGIETHHRVPSPRYYLQNQSVCPSVFESVFSSHLLHSMTPELLKRTIRNKEAPPKPRRSKLST